MLPPGPGPLHVPFHPPKTRFLVSPRRALWGGCYPGPSQAAAGEVPPRLGPPLAPDSRQKGPYTGLRDLQVFPSVPFISCSISSEIAPLQGSGVSLLPAAAQKSLLRCSQFGVQSCSPHRHAGRGVAPGREEGGEPGGEGETAPPAGQASPAGGGAWRGACLGEAGSRRPAATPSSCPPSAAVKSPPPDRGC